MSGLPPVTADGQVGERPTLLPLPGELPANEEIKHGWLELPDWHVLSATRLANRGKTPTIRRPTCSRSRLAFSLRTSSTIFRRPLSDLDALDRPANYIARRPARLLSLRAQILWSQRPACTPQGNRRISCRARGTGTKRVEETPAGLTVKVEASPKQVWGRYLTARAAEGVRPNRIHDSICSTKSTTFPSITRSLHPNRSRSTIGPATLLLLPSSAVRKRCRT